MADTKILQAILDGQSELKQGLIKVEKRIDQVEKNLESRLDHLGMHLAALSGHTN